MAALPYRPNRNTDLKCLAKLPAFCVPSFQLVSDICIASIDICGLICSDARGNFDTVDERSIGSDSGVCTLIWEEFASAIRESKPRGR